MRSSLTLQGINHIKRRYSLSPCVLCVCDRISNHLLKKLLKDTSRFIVYQSGDTLHASTSRKTSNRWLRNTLDVISQDFSVTLGTSLAKTFATFSSSKSHVLKS